VLKLNKILAKLGPGLLMAGAAIGVSHLVQSTRAGAEYGFALLAFVIIANLLKYPFLEAGPRYALATGKNLLQGYQQVGKWALWVYAIFTFGTMFTIQAAVTLFTASIAHNLVGIPLDLIWYSIAITALCVGILLFGHYHALNRLIRWIMVVLLASSILALIFVLIKGPVGDLSTVPRFEVTVVSLGFLLALMGWMPIPLDASVWHSFWALAFKKDVDDEEKDFEEIDKTSFSLKDGIRDFNIGYLFAASLAVLFMALGAYVMFGSGIEFSSSGAVFAEQLVSLYTKTLGNWAYPIILTAAFSTMFSTTITIVDSFPRVWEGYAQLINGSESYKDRINTENIYGYSMIFVAIGTLLLLLFFQSAFKKLIDFATILSFLTAPVIAYINYRVMMLDEIPTDAKWNISMKVLAKVGIVFLSVFSLFYLYWLVK
jgi:Mn2+/Fe2+ NRAMP family transporter